MRCPYLIDTRVKYCRVSEFKKMILLGSEPSGPEKCSTPGYLECDVARQHGVMLPVQACCPHLQEAPAQYCAAAPMIKFIPRSGEQLSSCVGESYRACEYYCRRAMQGNRERPRGAH